MTTPQSPDPLLALSALSEKATAGEWTFQQVDDNCHGVSVYEVSAYDAGVEALAEFFEDADSVAFVVALVNWFRANAKELTSKTTPHSDEAEAAAIELLRHRLCNDEDGWRALLTLLDALAYRKEKHRAANARGVVEVPQFHIRGCSDWYDGYPDTSDGKDWETRVLYSKPGSEVKS